MLDILRQSALALTATTGFAILFNVPRRSLWACALTGMAGFLARLTALRLGLPPAGAAFVAAATVSLLGELFAWRLQLPTAIFIVTGFIPLVPGVAAAQAMVHFLSGDTAGGAQFAANAALITGAIAAGIGGLGAAARALRLRRETVHR